MNFESSVINIAIEDIIPNRFQPRLVFDDASLRDLAASIKEHGIIQPLVVRRLGDKYEIVSGERRYRAAMMVGLTSVPAILSNIDDKTSAEVAISENVQRKELNPIEEAKSYQALLSQGFMNKQELAQKIGVPESVLQNKLKLLTLPKEVQDALLNNKISERHARSLLKLKESNEQIIWLNKIIDNKLNVKDLERELAKEYGTNDLTFNLDINKLKNESHDIDIPLIQPINNPNKNNFGPINLGEKNTNRFFNNLEDEQANMSINETNNPLNNSYLNFDFQSPLNNELESNQSTTLSSEDNNINFNNDISKIDNQLNHENVITSVDSLDFFPPLPQHPKNIDYSIAKNIIDNSLNILENSYSIQKNIEEDNDRITYIITISEKK
ncbi:MAG: ParB/RepB/Spo0J family partition protein [Bacilli bacterium]